VNRSLLWLRLFKAVCRLSLQEELTVSKPTQTSLVKITVNDFRKQQPRPLSHSFSVFNLARNLPLVLMSLGHWKARLQMNHSGTRTFHYALTQESPQLSCEYPTTYHSGETALKSGIYGGEHSARHKHLTEVVIIKDAPFPRCSTCGEPLEFHLVQSAVHISEDEDFQTEN
jgi:hypothetical protein